MIKQDIAIVYCYCLMFIIKLPQPPALPKRCSFSIISSYYLNHDKQFHIIPLIQPTLPFHCLDHNLDYMCVYMHVCLIVGLCMFDCMHVCLSVFWQYTADSSLSGDWIRQCSTLKTVSVPNVPCGV